MPAPFESESVAADLLIVDADVTARGRLARDLAARGFAVREAGSAADALAVLSGSRIDLLILDVALPTQNGVEVMRQARDLQREMLIVVLTGHASVDSAIAAVKVGVVDYMLKPCKSEDVDLIVTRALDERAQRRRHEHLLNMVGEAMVALRQPARPAPIAAMPAPGAPPGSQSALQVGLLHLDCQKRRLTIQSEPCRRVELSEAEVAILVKLMQRPNEVFTYRQLAETLDGFENMDKWSLENMIRTTVFRLRHKIETEPDGPRVICTVRGRGYYLSSV